MHRFSSKKHIEYIHSSWKYISVLGGMRGNMYAKFVGVDVGGFFEGVCIALLSGIVINVVYKLRVIE